MIKHDQDSIIVPERINWAIITSLTRYFLRTYPVSLVVFYAIKEILIAMRILISIIISSKAIDLSQVD